MTDQTPYLTWDSYETADACRDQDLYDITWQDLCENLTSLMNRINPDHCEWHCTVRNFGWRRLNGYKDFKAEDGSALLQAVLPNTECTFKIFDNGDHIGLANSHHDAPTGGELYTIEINRKWRIKALYDIDEETEEPLYWSDKGVWTDRDSAYVFIEREKLAKPLPQDWRVLNSRDIAAQFVEIGEWEEVDQ